MSAPASYSVRTTARPVLAFAAYMTWANSNADSKRAKFSRIRSRSVTYSGVPCSAASRSRRSAVPVGEPFDGCGVDETH